MRPRSLFLPLLSALSPVAAFAEEASPAPSAAEVAIAAPAESPAPAPSTSAPTAYERGVQAFARGDFQAAKAAFDETLAAPSAEGERARAQALRDLAERYLKTGARLVFPSGNLDAQKNPLALPDERTDDEIVSYYLTSVPYGIALGAYVSLLADSHSPAGFVFPVLGAVGLAAGGMAYADHKETRPYGQPQAIVSGLLIGLQVGIPLNALSDTTSGKESLGILLGSATVGGIGGYMASQRFATTPGEMSFVGSSALWANVLGVLGGAVAKASDKDFAPISLAMVAAGTTVGAIYARDFGPSIARVRYLDFGAVVGGLALGGTYLGLAASSGNGQTAAAVTAVGVIGGGALAAYLTRDMRGDAPRRATAVSFIPTFAPTDGGATVGLAGTF